eukprot:8531725-Ditylum_brightwellii.AAC.1
MGFNFKTNMGNLLSGTKQTVAKVKASSGEALDEGEKYIRFEVCSKLCEFLFVGEGEDHLFAHAFLTLE